MQISLANKLCLQHRLDMVALLFDQQYSVSEMILCPKCLVERQFLNNKVLIIREITEMVQEMKNEQTNKIQNILSRRQIYFKELSNVINQYRSWTEGVLSKIITQVNQNLESLEEQINRYNNNSYNNLIKEDDILNLRRFLNGQNDNDDKLYKIEDLAIVSHIKNQVRTLNNSMQFEQLIKLLEVDLRQFSSFENNSIERAKLNNENQQISWKFSQQYKHPKIFLSNDSKIAHSNDKIGSICCCDQSIPLNGTSAIEFMVHNMKFLDAGVCFKDKLNQDFEIFFYTNVNNHWCYFMFCDGQSFIHQKDSEKHNFKFHIKDIIRIEVNQKKQQITWINKTQNYSPITRDILPGQDLYFSFRMFGENRIQLL